MHNEATDIALRSTFVDGMLRALCGVMSHRPTLPDITRLLLTLVAVTACSGETDDVLDTDESLLDTPAGPAGPGPAAPSEFPNVAEVKSGVGPCPFDFPAGGIPNCYNRYNPPAPSIRRSFIRANIGATNTGAFGSGEATAGTFILPNHRSTVDGRIVTGDNRALFPLRPENLDYGLQMNGPRRPLSERGHFQFMHSIDPRPNRSRLSPTAIETIGGQPDGWDLCNEDGPSSKGARACAATGGGREIAGDCYDTTIVSAWGVAGEWDLRSLAVTLFVPRAKHLDDVLPHVHGDPNDRYTREISVMPRTAGAVLGELSDYDALKLYQIDPVTSQGDFSFKRFKEAVQNDCVNSNKTWCRMLTEQRWNQGQYYQFLDPTSPGGKSNWNGKTQNNKNDHHAILEPATTADGHLLFIHDYRQGILYSYSKNACDAAGWTTFKPISMAFQDPEINTRYGFAKMQMRRFDGTPISPGATINGGYPWVDRKGDNLFFPILQLQNDAWHGKTEIGGGSFHIGKPIAGNGHAVGRVNLAGVAVVGAWTKSKLVLLDNGLSPTDFGSTDFELRNEIFSLKLHDQGDVYFRPQGISLLSSLENRFNHVEAMTPVTPRDVVWMMSSAAQRNAEVPFDEYLRDDVLVAVPMNAQPREMQYNETDGGGYPQTAYVPSNGFQPVTTQGSLLKWDWHFDGKDIVLQNTATVAERTRVTLHGGAWIPPVAEGGVVGRGVFLDGFNDYIQIEGAGLGNPSNYYVGIWLDRRDNDPRGRHKLLQFFDGSSVQIAENDLAFVVPAGDGELVIAQVSVSAPRSRYTHVGIAFTTEGEGAAINKASVFIDGTLIETVPLRASDPQFKLRGSDPRSRISRLVIGTDRKGTPPIRAWVDDLRVLSLKSAAQPTQAYFLEEACNQALGSLQSDDTPGSHGRRFVCKQLDFRVSDTFGDKEVDGGMDFPVQAYTTRNCASTVHGREMGGCARAEALGIANKRLVFHSTRPDFSGVTFCKSCHANASNAIEGLRPNALLPGTVHVMDDPRRQPMAWPRHMAGAIPNLDGAPILPYSGSPSLYQTYLDSVFLPPTAGPPLPMPPL